MKFKFFIGDIPAYRSITEHYTRKNLELLSSHPPLLHTVVRYLRHYNRLDQYMGKPVFLFVLIQLWNASRDNEKLRAISDQYFFIEIQIPETEQEREYIHTMLLEMGNNVQMEITKDEFAPSWIEAFEYVSKHLPIEIGFYGPPVAHKPRW